jgi:hypothetical protein
MSKPEKADEKKFVDELCRFAGLFSIDPGKNTRIFHSMEQLSILWITCGKVHACRRRKSMHKRKHTMTPVVRIYRVVTLFGFGHNKIYDFIGNFCMAFHSKSKGDAHEAVKTTSSKESKQR